MTQRTLAALAFVAVLLAAFGGAYASSAQTASPTAVAVADIEKIFNALKEKETIEAQLREQGEGLQDEQNVMRAEVEELQGKLKMLPTGQQAYKDAQAELEQKLIELQVWGQYQEARLNRERAIQVEALYRKTLETIGRVATESGYDMVLFKEPAPNFQGANAQQISAVLQLRKVLWSKEDIDLTQQIITRMNNEFDAGR